MIKYIQMHAYKMLIIMGLIVAGGCNLLDVEPLTQIPAENAVQDKKGLDAAMAGAYDVLQSAAIAEDVVVFGDLAADNLIHVGTKKEYREISENRIFPSNIYVEGIWNSSYDGINRVNSILENIDNVEGLSQSEMDSYIAQCLFLRAFHHFNLVKYFGGVPVKLQATKEVDDANSERESSDVVYNRIITDLLDASELINGTGKVSQIYADEGAVNGLLARVYLYTSQWDSAIVHARNVLDMNYELVGGADYADLFNEEVSNNEEIFIIDFFNDDETNGMGEWFQPEARFEVAAWRTPDRDASIALDFAPGDLRKEVTVQSSDLTGILEYYSDKYSDFENDKDKVIVLRLSEMYLIMAEALNEKGYVADGEAFDMLNAVRYRAGLDSITSATVVDQQSFRLFVESERRFEFAFEGHRYFDLVRTGRARIILPDIGTLTTTNQFLFPIPQSEIDTNDKINENNPGY